MITIEQQKIYNANTAYAGFRELYSTCDAIVNEPRWDNRIGRQFFEIVKRITESKNEKYSLRIGTKNEVKVIIRGFKQFAYYDEKFDPDWNDSILYRGLAKELSDIIEE